MNSKWLICPQRRRSIKPPFAWVDRHFLFKGFMERLTPQENLLYFFLILAADHNGLSYYSYDRICRILKLDDESYLTARKGLIDKKLIAFDGRQYQVLALPENVPPLPKPARDEPRQPLAVPEPFAAICARIAARCSPNNQVRQ